MNRIRTTIATFIALAGAVGCNPSAPNASQAKVEAYQRWNLTRASMLVGVGEEQFKTGDLDNARNSGREALALSPELTAAQILLARVSIEKGNYIEAQNQLDAAAARDPKNAKIVYLKAVTLEKRAQFEQALTLYEKARAMEPSNPAYILASAEVMVSLGRATEALELVESKLENMDQTVGMLKAAGELALLANKLDKAVEHFLQARSVAPDDLTVQESLAKAYFQAGRTREALAALEELRGKGDYDRRPWLHTMLGESYLSAEKPREAKASFERATELEPAQARHWIGLAKAALVCKDTPRTILAANQALRLDSKQTEAHLLLGYALLMEGKAAEANAMLISAVQANPDQAMLQCLLGRSYSVLGDEAKARACYQAMLNIEPGNPVARQLLASAKN